MKSKQKAYRCHRPESLAVVCKQIWPLVFGMNRGLKMVK